MGLVTVKHGIIRPSERLRDIVNDCLDKVNDSWGKVKINGFIRKKKTPDSIKPDVLFWWGMVDSNHRRHCQQIYSLSPLATREIPHIDFC